MTEKYVFTILLTCVSIHCVNILLSCVRQKSLSTPENTRDLIIMLRLLHQEGKANHAAAVMFVTAVNPVLFTIPAEARVCLRACVRACVCIEEEWIVRYYGIQQPQLSFHPNYVLLTLPRR